ncbi:cell division control protein 48 homolog C [Cajanus cajan]|uniref:Cell division control protein 48 isogeny C n=1 Tax=Cajanus cajan TaxID=3821 RepID=A0A151T803_CAJCA|nr:cell division control protein 48 homolog C [Cajanus cajan]KYP63173.1 Cell division control protein 48 isogeny C [Cajanus cajan]
MGRRNGGRSLQDTLRRRLESCKSKYSTAEQIANHLRSTYPDYHRTKHQTLIRFVQEALNSTPSLNHSSDDDHEAQPPTASRKRRKRVDQSEERLQRIEALHVRRRLQTDSSSEEENVSSSEDAIYGEKVEPQFDLMKTMLRKSYMPKKEKNVELEVGNSNKGTVTSTLMNEEGKEVRGSVSNVDVKGNDWPRFRDLGGMKEVLEELKMEVIVPLYHPQLPRQLGVRPMAGILLHGPPGCGKTKLAHAIANETGLPFYQISATEVVSGVSGASEENIRELFSKAYRTAPSIVFIDEIDAIASKREDLQREMEKRIVTQLMTCMDQSNRLLQPENESEGSDGQHPGYVLVIGATNRPDAIDPALRRPGRFDREIIIGIADESAREEILSTLTNNLTTEGLFDLRKIAKDTAGYVGADLVALVNKAGNLAMKRIIVGRRHDLSQDHMNEHAEDWWRVHWLPEEINKLAVKMSDFEEAVNMVQPSLRRDGFSPIPDVKWEDVGGLDLLRQEFERYIVRRIKYPEDYEGLGIDLEMGFLLYGPPGCGKTLIAKAVAHEAGANFIHVKGPSLLNKYVGESELAVRRMFSDARTCAPCIIFFDEVDALTTTRGKEGGWVIERLLNQLLIELDGAERRRGVFVIGATNRPEVMDRALLRPGRFGKLLYVPLPSPDERVLILKALARKKCIDASVDLSAIAKMEACENLSGADLSALMNEAAMAVIDEKETLTDLTHYTRTIKRNHFEVALRKVSPSVSDRQKQYYQRLSQSFKAA